MKWKWQKTIDLEIITIPDWRQCGTIAAFSSRQGGFSQGAYASLNLALHVGDKYAQVLDNRRRFLQAVGGELDQAVCCDQVHSSTVLQADDAMKGRGAWCYDDALPACDGLVCNKPGIYLMTFYADCFPLYFFDPRQKVIGLAHSGWKGTYEGIGVETVNRMISVYGCRVENIEVFIGPGIQPCCFEIQKDLADQVEKRFPGPGLLGHNKKGNLVWNLPGTIIFMLQKRGLRKDHIYHCGLCTVCDESHFFSYRREQGLTGRMGAVIALQDRAAGEEKTGNL